MRKRIYAVLLTLSMLLAMLPVSALAAEPCDLTDGCTLEAGHEGDCVTASDDEELVDGDDDDSYETDEVADPAGLSAQEQLAALIAALPDPEDIDPTDEVQVEAVYEQIAEIYAFAEANDLDVEDNETVNAVIAVAWPAMTLEDETVSELTAAGGSLASGTYKLTDDIKLTTDLTIPADATVTIDLNGHT